MNGRKKGRGKKREGKRDHSSLVTLVEKVSRDAKTMLTVRVRGWFSSVNSLRRRLPLPKP